MWANVVTVNKSRQPYITVLKELIYDTAVAVKRVNRSAQCRVKGCLIGSVTGSEE